MSTIALVAAPVTRLHAGRRVLSVVLAVAGVTLFLANSASIWVTGNDLLGRFQF